MEAAAGTEPDDPLFGVEGAVEEVVPFEERWEAAVANPVAAWELAWLVWPGSDPVAAAAAVPRPNAATAAAAATLAVMILASMDFLLEGDGSSEGADERTSAAAAAVTDALRDNSSGEVGDVTVSNSEARPA